jgi:hypothetical protein
MGPEEECISCNISTIRALNRNKEPHTGGTYPGEYVFLDILHPVVATGLTKESTFPFYLFTGRCIQPLQLHIWYP